MGMTILTGEYLAMMIFGFPVSGVVVSFKGFRELLVSTK